MKPTLVECLKNNIFPTGEYTNEEYVDALAYVRKEKKFYEDAEKAYRAELIKQYKDGKLKDFNTSEVKFSITSKPNEKFLEEAFIEAIKTDEAFKSLSDLIVSKTVESIDFDKLEAKITLGEVDADALAKFNEVKDPTLTLNTKPLVKKIKTSTDE